MRWGVAALGAGLSYPVPPANAQEGGAPGAASVESGALPTIEVEGEGRSAQTGYLARRTSSATRTDTPLINVPQSVTVVTGQQIRDQSFQSVGEAVRYVPGVIPHQGESNRDDVVIRGQRSNADFFVNGIRDDAQYFRDLYNTERLEVLKGPNAMIFGRGGGGGVINRMLKSPDGVLVRDVSFQGGPFGDKRFAVDLGGAPTDVFAARLNAVYEDTDSYRRFVEIRRYGVNPVVSFLAGPATRVTLGYEFFHDDRTTDRGIPSQFGRPYAYRSNVSTYFGNPFLSHARVDAQIGTALVEHETESGVTIRSNFRVADYDKFYQNVFPAGPVNNAGTSLPLAAYNNRSDRENLFNQTDFTYKVETGWLRHTLLGGFELGRQTGLSFRQDGFFATTGTGTLSVNPLFPVTAVPVTFRNVAGANNTYRLGLGALYVQDQIEIGDHLQIVGGLRFDRFDLSSRDRRTGGVLAREDNLLSPRAGVIVKPVETLSLYGSYSVSHLPSAGDQFSALSPGLVIAEPERFENREVGIKWDVTPQLQLTAAAYELDRTNQRLPDPNRAGFFLLSGATSTTGFEIGASGTVTEGWQVAGGYAYTDARILRNISATIVAGNTVGLVPSNTLTVWNKFDITPNWALGVGVINQSHAFASSDNTVRLPGFTRVDAGAFFRLGEHLRAQVNIENLLDRRYIATADGNNNITPGSPRAVRFQMTASF
jgi:catecholate siderophore receptor